MVDVRHSGHAATHVWLAEGTRAERKPQSSIFPASCAPAAGPVAGLPRLQRKRRAGRMLILFAPGPPREEYFTELADIRSSGRTMTDEDWISVWARHDQYPA